MKQRKLGNEGPAVSEIALGAMGMSGLYGPSDREENIATVHAALDAGINLIDTGDFYGMGRNEMLLGEALKSRQRDDFLVSVKFGAQRAPDGNWIGYDASPNALKTALSYSLSRLGLDHIDIYRPARLDPKVPIEETVGAIAELIEAGYVRYLGLSEVGPETIRRAAAVHPVTDLQIEYSLMSRGMEEAILPVARELGIGITAYGVLSRGLLSGNWSPERQLDPTDFRAHAPRFQGKNLKRNLELTEQLRAIADEKDSTVAQLAIAWVLSRGEDIVPLVGARRRDRLAEALGGSDLDLDVDTLSRIEASIPEESVAGTRYPEPQMGTLDSER